MRRVFTALIAGGLALPAATAYAQAYQCRVPSTAITVPRIAPEGPARRIPITGYSLALSWSPEYCRIRADNPGDAMQCSGHNGRFGFVLHGLWPEGTGGRWPQWCPTPRALSPVLARQHLCMMPSTRLMAHEWAKHGSCMVRTPESYFKVSQILWDSLRLPDLNDLSRQDTLNAGAIRHAFLRRNPDWRAEQVGVHLNARGWLTEMRLCYGKDYRPARCSPTQFGARDSARARIWRGKH